MSKPRPFAFILLAGLGAFGLALGAISLYDKYSHRNAAWDQVAGPTPSHLEQEKRCQALIGKAELAAKDAVAQRAQQFHDFVAQRQYRTLENGRVAVVALADELLTLGSKGRLIWSKMPFTDRDGYQKHVSALFSKYLFTAEELGAAFNRAVDGSVKDVDAIENQLAVDLQEIITGTPASPGLRANAPAQLQAAMASLVAAGQHDAGKDLLKLTASEVTSAIGVQVLVRLGVSAGILGTGAASAPWTLGAGLVIGLLADMAWGWIDNPEANLQRDILRSTSKIAVDGMNALNAETSRLVERRKVLWELSANKMLP